MIKAVERARAAAEKALEEANARMTTTEARLRVLATEKDVGIQALSQEKINQASLELSLIEKEKWRASESNRLTAALGESRAKMRKEWLNKAKEYAMHFRWSTLLFIHEKHPRIDLSEIDFGSLRGNNVVDPNNESTTTLAEKASGDEKEGGSDVVEDVEEVAGP